MSESIAKSQWKDYCDNVSKAVKGAVVEVEVEALGIFDKIEAEWLPLLGITYDPKDDLVSIFFEKLDHMIEKPLEITVDKGDQGLNSIEITSGEDAAKTVVKFRTPVKV